MPSKNIVKIYADEQYYHVYNRGVNKSNIFIDDTDYVVFLSLLKRHLGIKPTFDKFGRPYKHLRDSAALLSYCLMPNHFHLLLLNKKDRGIEQLMRSVSTAYARYFNNKYQRVGPVFQSNFKASLINSDMYLMHISRYIHLNPKDYKIYKYSSYKAITESWSVEWLSTEELMNTFDGTRKDYAEFVADYEDYKEMLDAIKDGLADQ